MKLVHRALICGLAAAGIAILAQMVYAQSGLFGGDQGGGFGGHAEPGPDVGTGRLESVRAPEMHRNE